MAGTRTTSIELSLSSAVLSDKNGCRLCAFRSLDDRDRFAIDGIICALEEDPRFVDMDIDEIFELVAVIGEFLVRQGEQEDRK